MAAEIIIAGVSAAIEAVDFWLTHKDKIGAFLAGERAYPKINTDSRLKNEARRLESIVPADVLEVMAERVQRCWDRYKEILKDEGGYLPQEVDAATKALQRCICRELGRIHELNGAIPPGVLTTWWLKYCAKS